jgi:sugar O-acyltransferase (sialic acid O-acetyltransferase NeuD family)
LKGLKLSQSNVTKRKYFVQNFWFNNKSDYWTVGEFRLDVYGINQCRKEVNEIMDDHTNSEGLWIKNPKITKRHKNERVKKAEILNRQMKTVRECIVELCKSNFPKIKKEGTLTGQTIRKFCLPLIGYNKRTQHLVYDDDNFGNGYVTFKASHKFNTNKPESWDDLFSKFPPGHGCIKKIKLVLGIGINIKLREKILKKFDDYKFLILIDKNSIISSDCNIAQGSVIFPGATIGPNVKIGKFSVIHNSVVIEHDVSISENSYIGPGAVVCGNAKIGKNVLLGANSTMIQDTFIEKNCKLGAGSVLIKSFKQQNKSLIGAPAKIKK